MLMKNITSPNDGDVLPEGNSDNLIPSDCPDEFSNFFRSQSPSTANGGFHHHADDSRLNNLEGRAAALLHRCPFKNCCHSVATQTSVPSTLPPAAPEMTAHYTPTRSISTTTATDTCHRLRSPLVSRPRESALSKEDIRIVASRLLAQGFPAEALGTAAQQQFSQCQADIRKAAVECMLAQLNLDAKTNSSTVNEIQKRLRRLENQVFCEAKSGLEYFILIATKLADVFYELQKARSTRSAPVQSAPFLARSSACSTRPPLAQPLLPATPPSTPLSLPEIYIQRKLCTDACSQVLLRHKDTISPTLS